MTTHPSSEPLALFGGTFDPVHYGHLRCADEARQKLKLGTLHLLPASTPPHRASTQATAEQRMTMLQLAQPEFPRLLIDDREYRRSGPSYMVDSLREIRQEFPQRPLLLLLGQDAASELHSWHDWEQLFTLTHFVILTRPGKKESYRQDLARQMQRREVSDVETLVASDAGSVLKLEVTPIDISATIIKSMIRLGRSPRSMLPDAVLDYINLRHLYSPV